MENKEIDTRKSRLIFDARMARKLLKMGFVVIDIKPNRENTEKKRISNKIRRLIIERCL